MYQDHVEEMHLCEQRLPEIYRPPPSNKRMKVPKHNDDDGAQTIWEVPGVRLAQFVAPGTVMKCRICGVVMGGVHGREQHERDVHKFTEQVKRKFVMRQVLNRIFQACNAHFAQLQCHRSWGGSRIPCNKFVGKN